ncbi:MAG: hypothetical protein JSW71_05590 [Gemmatimonadota bacterium]|nr:MAG: hypothetical protein JSW71_05590 [Gemmatimonadota bacterium]
MLYKQRNDKRDELWEGDELERLVKDTMQEIQPDILERPNAVDVQQCIR